MGENYKKEIQEIMSRMECTRDFWCCNLDHKPICKVKDVELENHLEIEGAYDFLCKHSVENNGVHYCKCPLSVYLTKKIDT